MNPLQGFLKRQEGEVPFVTSEPICEPGSLRMVLPHWASTLPVRALSESSRGHGREANQGRAVLDTWHNPPAVPGLLLPPDVGCSYHSAPVLPLGDFPLGLLHHLPMWLWPLSLDPTCPHTSWMTDSTCPKNSSPFLCPTPASALPSLVPQTPLCLPHCSLGFSG